MLLLSSLSFIVALIAVAPNAEGATTATLPPCPGFNGTSTGSTCVLPSSANGWTLSGPSTSLAVSPSLCPTWFKKSPQYSSNGGLAYWCSKAFTFTVSGSGTTPYAGGATPAYFGPGLTNQEMLQSEAPPGTGGALGHCSIDPTTLDCVGTSTYGPVFLEGRVGTYGEIVFQTGSGFVTSYSQYPLQLAVIPYSSKSSPAPVSRKSPLSVTVAFMKDKKPLVLSEKGQPSQTNTLRLADDDKGEIAQDVTVEVTLKNTSSKVQTNVNANGLPAFSYSNAANARQSLPIAITAGPFSMATGKPVKASLKQLGPGESVSVTYSANVANNGVFDCTVQVLSTREGSNVNLVSQGVGTITVLPSALLWLALQPSTTSLVQAGTSIVVSGKVTNRSLTQSIDVEPLIPTVTGNAGVGALVDLLSTPNSDGTISPYAGVLKPGESVDLIRVVGTAPFPGTRAQLTYDPQGSVINATGTKTTLTPTQIGMSKDTSPILIHISTADPAVATSDSPLIDGFTQGAIDASDELFIETLSSTANLLAHPIDSASAILKGLAGFAVTGAETAGQAAYLALSLHLYQVAYLALTPAERTTWQHQLESDLLNSNIGLASNAVIGAAEGYVTKLSAAIASNDYTRVGFILGHDSTTALGATGQLVLSDLFFQKLAIGFKAAGSALAASATGKAIAASGSGELLKAVSLESSIKKFAVSPVTGKLIEGIPAGTDLLANGARLLIEKFGMTPRQITELIAYCKRSNIIIAIRSRSSRAAELIAKGLAIGKNEIIKLKNVNWVDTQFLGYSKHDLNTIVWAKPLTKAEVEASIVGADATTRQIVLDRWQLRVEEWNDPKIKSLINTSDITGKIDWSFNGASNGAPGANKVDERLFKLQKSANPSKYGGATRPYSKVLVGSKPGLLGRLVAVTQDVDMMAILGLNGKILSPAERTAAYIHLSDVLGIEHGETPSFIKDGEIMFQAKAKYLADVIQGGEQVAVFSPYGSSAGFFDPALTVFDQSTMSGRVFFDGGYNNPYSKTLTSIQLSLANMANYP